ncbi:MAG: glycosyltransferase [Lachnospiraceae bacterium]|nr:glycosyltransferase [Lachnospiraceae bacterium]
MKVSLLNDSFPPVIDGVANVVMNYARIMTERNLADVMVGTPKYPDTDYTSYPYRVVPYQSFDTTGIVSGYRAGNPFAMKAIEEMTSFRPDIIHTHCPVSSTVMARILRNEIDAPIVFTYHTKFDVDIARAVSAKFLQKESIRTLVDNITACDEVWVVSQGAGENLKSLGYEGSCRVMANGVDFAKGRVEEADVRKATKGYDLPEGIPVFLFVGRMMKYKGLPLILDAMKILADEARDFRMVFVGSGADAEEMQQKAKTLGISDKVIFTGAVYERDVLRAWNTRADLFLFPSTYDTNGIVVREAAACGLASVLIKGSCAAEGITHGRNGYMIEENAESMAALLREVCKDINRVHEVGQHAMDEIYISWEDAVVRAHERYGEILDLKKRGYLTGRRREPSDYFLNIAANLVEHTDKIFGVPKKLYEGMQDNFEELWDDFRETKMADEMRKVRKELREKKEAVSAGVMDFYDNEKEYIRNIFTEDE